MSVGMLCEYLKGLKPGEDVLIEYTSHEPAYLILHRILKCLQESKRAFMIIDELDQLHIFKAHLKLAGLSSEIIDNAKVIKFGGIIQTGRVLGRLDLSKEPPVRKEYYEKILEKLNLEYSVRVVVGFDKVLEMHSNTPRELENLLGYLIRPHLGDERRTTIYLVNTDIIADRTLKEVREHASRVLQAKFMRDRILLKVIKSVNIKDFGKEIQIDVS